MQCSVLNMFFVIKTQFFFQAKFQHLSAVDDINASDLAYLKDIYDKLSKRQEGICKEIESLKYKGKMFPPIHNQNMSNKNVSRPRVNLTKYIYIYR